MKKLFIMISLLSISFSKTVELKIGTSFSNYVESAEYVNDITKTVNGVKRVEKISKDSNNFDNFGGEIYVKAIKPFELKNDIEVKVGAGVSFEINQRGDLKKYLEKVKLENNSYTSEQKEDAEEMFKVAENGAHYSISSFGNLEISKKVYDDLKIYGSFDLGLNVLLNGNETKSFSVSPNGADKDIVILTRTTAKYRPKVKGVFGLNYRNFDVELGLGFPGVASFGIGTRIGI